MHKYIIIFTILVAAFFMSCDNIELANDEQLVKEFRITLDETELANIYKNYKQDIYIDVVVKTKKDSAKGKMRLRGDTSREYDKKSMKIVFPKGGKLIGEKRKINLNSEWTDKTYIRQYISALLMKKAGLITFDANYVATYINNKFFGLFLQVENIDDKFLKKNKLSPKGNLYKATKDGACLSMFEYKKPQLKWEKKSNKKDKSYADLQELIFNINNTPKFEFYAYIKNVFEYDKLISLVAMNMLIQNHSTYYHNYYLYHDVKGNSKWQIMPWDLDKSLSYYSWKPYKYHETSSNWESDNPLIERMFLDKNIVKDIKTKVNELTKNVFNSRVINPIIDNIENNITKYVDIDSSDKIKDIKHWKNAMKHEKEYITKQTKYMLNQLNTFPSSFELLYSKKKYTESPKLYWTAAKSTNTINYTLLYGKHFLLEDSTTVKIENLKDTSYQIFEELKKGEYFWRVYANDGKNTVEGFNTKSTFEIIEKTNILTDIKKNTTLTKEKSPYFITKDIHVEIDVTLTVNPGVEIIFSEKANLYVNGDIKMLGEKYLPISLNAEKTEWGSVYIINNKGNSVINHTLFINGAFRSKYATVELNNTTFDARNKTLEIGEHRESLIWVKDGKFTFKNSQVLGAGQGEGLNINYAETVVENSYFENIPDAIELIDVSKGIVRNNIAITSPDDAIDMNGCKNILIENNILLNNQDKGISIGTEQYGPSTNIIVKNNLIVNNHTGVSIKDSSFAIISNNIFISNNISLEARLKNNRKKYKLGGTLKVDNCYFINSRKHLVSCDKNSHIDIEKSVSNKQAIEGSGNNIQQSIDINNILTKKFEKIKFRTYSILDFSKN